jgi:hypothetical protein
MRRILFLALSLSSAFVVTRADVICAATVHVVTSQGRTLAGDVDARTDDNRLWLRQQLGVVRGLV